MISYRSLPLQLALIVVSLAGFTLIVVSNRGKYFVIRGRVLVYGKTMVIAVDPRSAGNYTPRPRPTAKPDAFRQRATIRGDPIVARINNDSKIPKLCGKRIDFEEERKRVEKLFSSRFSSVFQGIEDIW